jgi:hypothetical protein
MIRTGQIFGKGKQAVPFGQFVYAIGEKIIAEKSKNHCRDARSHAAI